jgi:hypothetical protein
MDSQNMSLGTMTNSYEFHPRINSTNLESYIKSNDFTKPILPIESDISSRTKSPLPNQTLYDVFQPNTYKPPPVVSTLIQSDNNQNLNNLIVETKDSINRSSRNIVQLLQHHSKPDFELTTRDLYAATPNFSYNLNPFYTEPSLIPSTDSNADILQYDYMNDLHLRNAMKTSSLSQLNFCDDLPIRSNMRLEDIDSYLLSRPIIGKYHYNQPSFHPRKYSDTIPSSFHRRHNIHNNYFSSSNPCLNSTTNKCYSRYPSSYDYDMRDSHYIPSNLNTSTPLYSSAISLAGNNSYSHRFPENRGSMKKNFLKRHVSFKNQI